MSGGAFAMIPRAVLTNRQIGHAAIVLYGILGTYANSEFECWPSQETLRRDMGVKDARSIRFGLAELEDAGLIQRRARIGQKGLRVGTLYRLCIEVGGERHADQSQQMGTGRKTSGPELRTGRKTSTRAEADVPVREESQLPLEQTNEHTKTPLPPSEVTPQEPPRRKARAKAKTADLFATPDQPAKKQPTATRLPDDWYPDARLFGQAAQEGFSHAEIERIAANFTDYWRAASGSVARKCDWSAAFRVWVRREADRKARSDFHGGAPNGRANGHGAAGSNPIAAAVATVVAAHRANQNRH